MGSSQAAAPLTDSPFERTVTFRNIAYRIRELEIGEFDEISEQAKVKRTIDGNEIELVDRQVQTRLMMRACIIEPKNVRLNKLGTRVYGSLAKIIDEMHFGEEPDETKKGADDRESDEEKPSGNA